MPRPIGLTDASRNRKFEIHLPPATSHTLASREIGPEIDDRDRVSVGHGFSWHPPVLRPELRL